MKKHYFLIIFCLVSVLIGRFVVINNPIGLSETTHLPHKHHHPEHYQSHSSFKNIQQVNLDTSDLTLDDIVLYTKGRTMFFDPRLVKNLPHFTVDSIFHYYGHWFDFGKDNQPILERTASTQYSHIGEETTGYYKLLHKGIETDCGGASFDVRNGVPYSISITSCNLDIDTVVNISNEDALSLAKLDLDGYQFTWEQKEEGWKIFGEKPIPKKKIILFLEANTQSYRLAYEFHIPTTSLKAFKVQVCVNTGEILLNRNDGGNCSACPDPGCSFNTEVVHNTSDILYYSVPRDFNVQHCSSSQGSCKKFRQTINQNLKLLDFTSGPSNDEICWQYQGSNISTPPSSTFNTAYWGTEMVYKYLKSTFNYHGYDNSNGLTNIIITSGGNSSYFFNPPTSTVPASVNIHLGTGNSYSSAWTTLDAIGHEIMHIIDAQTTKLKDKPNFSEAGAIMEGFCDIFGIVVEGTVKNIDWAIQNDFNQNEIRYLDNPANSIYNATLAPQPKTYLKNNWLTPTNTPNLTNKKYIHHNNGVMNYWFYLLANGGNGTNDNGDIYNVQGISVNKSINIVFETLRKELGKNTYSNKNFSDLRKATLTVTEQEYGACSTEWETVRQAWDAVGVYGNCEANAEISIQEVSAPENCDCNVSIQICGADSYEIIWKDGNKMPFEPANPLNVQGLCNETYTVTIKVDGCDDINKTIDCRFLGVGSGQSTNPPLNEGELEIGEQINNNCGVGDVLLSVTGGNPPYTFAWSDGSTGQDLLGVSAGTYYVTVSNPGQGVSPVVGGPYQVGHTMPSISNYHITQPCYGQTNGFIDITVSGGTSPFSYNWSTGDNTQDISVNVGDIGDVSSSVFSVTVTDFNGCATYGSYYVAPRAEIQLNPVVQEACAGTTNGAISLSPTGGSAPYTYYWNTNSTNSNISQLLAGNPYYVTVTDAVGCQKIQTITIPIKTATEGTDMSTCTRWTECDGNYIVQPYQDIQEIASYSSYSCQVDLYCNIDGSHIGTNYGTSTTMYSGGAMVPFPSALSHFYCNEIQTCIVEGVTYQNSTPYPASLGTCTYTHPYHYCEVYCGTTYLGTIGYSGALPLEKNKKLTVSPNPFKNTLNLSFESNSEQITISIFNLLGEEIMTKYTATNIGQNDIQLNNLNQLSNGIYILKIAFNDGTFLTKKIMHQK